MTSSTVPWEQVRAEIEARQSTWRWRLSSPFHRAWHKYNPRELRRRVRWGVQRWRRGYSDLDVWNTDHHLCRIIPPMMRQLSRELHGVPGTIAMRFEADTHAERMELAVAEWRRILLTVADGFEAWTLMDAEHPDGERLAELTARWKEGSALLIEHFGAFWD